MKVLRAKNRHPDIGFKLLEIPVREIRIIPPMDWIENRSKEFDYKTSFDNKGMLWPIVVTPYDIDWVKERILPKNPHHESKIHPGELMPFLYVHVGNKRVLYAQQNGYDRIEGYCVHTKEDKNYIQRLQHIPHTEIPK